MKILRTVCLLCALLLLFTACAGLGGNEQVTTEVPPTTPSPEDIPHAFSDFQIVRPDKATDKEIDGMIRVKNAIKAYTGKNPTLKTDFKESDQKVCEILIGETNRPETGIVAETLKAADYVVQTVYSDNGVKIVLLGPNENLTLSAVDEFIELLNDGKVIDADGNYTAVNSAHNYYDEFENYTMKVSDPVVVMQSEEDDQHWGHYQFPYIFYTANGSIMVTWSYHDDSIYTSGGSGSAYSTDGGKTWKIGNGGNRVYDPIKTGTTKDTCFAGFAGRGGYVVDMIDAEPVVVNGMGNVDVYLAKDLNCYNFQPQGIFFNSKSGGSAARPVTVNWPYLPVNVNVDPETGLKTFVYPTEAFLAINSYVGVISTDSGLYYCTYARGIDSKTGEVTKYSGYYSTYVFHSADGGYTWNYISQVSMTDEIFAEANINKNCEGFCEPTIAITRNGTFMMLLRTGSNNPCYIVRSTDNCQTWSKPEKFADCGVYPQLLTLDCGVTLASYGRPKLYITSSNDPDAINWKRHRQIPLTLTSGGSRASCFYTYLLRVDATTAMLVYSDFQLPNADRQPRKAILVRTIEFLPSK